MALDGHVGSWVVESGTDERESQGNPEPHVAFP